jgi:hypothetical protein
MAGAAMQAHILARAGYPAWECADRAMLRATQFAYRTGFNPTGDDVGVPPLINAAYGASFTWSGFEATKNFCCTGWTHGAGLAAPVMDIAPVVEATAPEQRIVVADSLGDLADEVGYLESIGWVRVGESTKTVDGDGNALYAQAMSNEAP